MARELTSRLRAAVFFPRLPTTPTRCFPEPAWRRPTQRRGGADLGSQSHVESRSGRGSVTGYGGQHRRVKTAASWDCLGRDVSIPSAALTESIAAPQVKTLVGVPNGGSVPASTIITDFEVRYDQIMDAAAVTNPSSYDLRSPGRDGLFDTTDDSVFNLAIANPYYYGTNSIEVNIVGGALGIGDYRLTIAVGRCAESLRNGAGR